MRMVQSDRSAREKLVRPISSSRRRDSAAPRADEQENGTSLAWMPRLREQRGPQYLAIVEALAQDVASGLVPHGSRLLPQREMASRLGLAVGTVAKAYAEAERRGLTSGEVGRGTFVNVSNVTELAAPAHNAVPRATQPIDMSVNVPPDTGDAAFVADALLEVGRSEEMAALLGYLPHAGLATHRAEVAAWIARDTGHAVAVDRLLLCNGAQHAIAVAMMTAQRPGGTMLAEVVTFPGIVGLAERLGQSLHGVPLDGEGLIPEALDAAFTDTGARLLYCMPTLQTPTGAVMSSARRRAIVAVLRRHDALAIEDDVYAFLAPGIVPLAALAPERVLYVNSLAKSVAPGLRIGALTVPDHLRDRAAGAMRSTGWMASPLLAATAVQLLRAGSVVELAARKRAVAEERSRLAHEVLGSRLAGLPERMPAFHLWLPLSRPPIEIITEAAANGVVLALPSEAPGCPAPRGLRICFGAIEQEQDLRRAFGALAEILDRNSGRAIV
jgi:DNA-binding transcriptional MocR family regulator